MTIQEKIYKSFEQNEHKHVLFVFDKLESMASELRDLSWKDGYEYHDFDGSWFRTKYAIHHEWKDRKVILCFQMLPPGNETAYKNFPLLGELKANMQYTGDDAEAFMEQKHLHHDMAMFVKKNIDFLQLEKHNRMLEPYYQKGEFTQDVGYRAFISGYMDSDKLLEWNDIIIRLIIMDGVEEEHQKGERFATRIIKNSETLKALNARIQSIFHKEYEIRQLQRMRSVVQSLKYNAIMQNLTIKQEDDYHSLYVDDKLAIDRQNTIREAGMNTPLYKEKFNKAFAFLGKDVDEKKIMKCYGLNASYAYMTETMIRMVIKDIALHQITANPEEGVNHTESLLLRLADNANLRKCVEFINIIGQYYLLASKASSQLKRNTPEEYISFYTETFYKVDRNYRVALEKYYSIESEMSELYDAIQQTKQQLDKDYANLVNLLNIEWISCVCDKGHFPQVEHQQDFYEKNVANNTTTTVVVVSDALRYEVATEVQEKLLQKKHDVQLDMALTILPTETVYAKHALLPHHQMTLANNKVMLEGNDVSNTPAKEAQLKIFKDDAVCLRYEDVNPQEHSADKNREKFKHNLVYLFHQTVDKEGHDDNGKTAVDGCRKAVNELAEIIEKIMASYNRNTVILTADHGFLFNDMIFEDKDKQHIQEDAVDPKSRYYLTSSNAKIDNIAKWPIREVSGIDRDLLVAVPVGTNRLAAPGGGYKFAHGGASLQEMVIPVMTCTRRRFTLEEMQRVEVMLLDTNNLSITSSALQITVIQKEAVTNEVKGRTVTVAIYDKDMAVTRIQEIVLNSTNADPMSRMNTLTLTLEKPIATSILELRIFDKDDTDKLNPLVKATVRNNTLIERDEF